MYIDRHANYFPFHFIGFFVFLSFFGAIEIEILLSLDFYGKTKFIIYSAIHSA